MAEPQATFAGLLRKLRARARLTQEDLAEAAGVSPRTISDLERGIHLTAHKGLEDVCVARLDRSLGAGLLVTESRPTCLGDLQ